jgi:hypothetical protein
VASKDALKNLEMDVETDAAGQPAFIVMTKGAVTRKPTAPNFSGSLRSGRSNEIAFASPGGFEPPLAT